MVESTSQAIIIVTGNVGGEAEMRFTPSGKAVTTISVATYGYGEMPTEWYNCTAWEGMAEAINEINLKGARVRVTGRYHSKEFVYKAGKKAGQPGHENNVTISKFEWGRREDLEFKEVVAKEASKGDGHKEADEVSERKELAGVKGKK